MITEERLKELERLEKAATEGPWDVDACCSREGELDVVLGYQVPKEGNPVMLGSYFFDDERTDPFITLDQAKANAKLTAKLRSALPDLISTIRTLRAENEGLKKQAEMLVPINVRDAVERWKR